MSRKEHYNITLQIPVSPTSGSVVRVPSERNFRIVCDQSGATGRHHVHEGQMVVLKSGQWFLLTKNQISVEEQVFQVIRTNRAAVQWELTGKYEHGGDTLDPSGPYSQKLIEALYYFGYYTDVVRRSMLDNASKTWIKNSILREKNSIKESLLSMLQHSYITVEEARAVIDGYANRLSNETEVS